MTIIAAPEPNFNSYTDVAFADAYLTVRYDDWIDLDEDAKERQLVRATDFIRANYLIDDVTDVVKNATSLLAYLSVTKPLVATVEEQSIKSQSSAMGSMNSSVEYRDLRSIDRFPQVSAMLRAAGVESVRAGVVRTVSVIL